MGANKGVCANCGQEFLEPQPGPQVAFATCPARILIFGGNAGGGKSASLTIDPLKFVNRYPGFGAALFRRNVPEVTGPGSLWEKAEWWYPKAGGNLVRSPQHIAAWTNQDGPDSTITFTHLDVVDRTVLSHDGKEYAYIGIDEGQYLTEFEIWYLFTRNRTSSGAPPLIRITCNPDPDCYLRKLIDWWIGEDGYPIPERDGVIRWCVRPGDDLVWFDTEAECEAYIREYYPDDTAMRPISVTFIRSTVDDNQIQGQEWVDEYKGALAMTDAATRAKKLGGNWNAAPEPGVMFNRTWFGILDREPDASQIEYMVRGWDKAGSKPNKKYPDPDWTRGSKLYRLKNGDVVIADMVSARDTPGNIDSLIYHTALTDGPLVDYAFWIDPGQAGLVDEGHIRLLFAGRIMEGNAARPLGNVLHFEKQTKNKVEYAKLWSSYADPAVPIGKIWLVRGPWNGQFLHEIESFPKPKGKNGEKMKDDQVDAVSRAFLEISKRKTSTPNRFMQAMQKAQIGRSGFDMAQYRRK